MFIAIDNNKKKEMKMKKFFIVLTVLFFSTSPAFADNLLNGPKPETFPPVKACAKCHNVPKIYDELAQSSHSDLTCLDCHVPGTAQKSKYKAADRSFYHLGYYDDEQGKWHETMGNKVCLRCHTDRESEKIEKKCWDCHMPVRGSDNFVLVKDKKLPPKGDNIRVIKMFPHRSHFCWFHIETNTTKK